MLCVMVVYFLYSRHVCVMVVYFLYSRACYVLWSSILRTVGHVCVMVIYFLYSRHVCVTHVHVRLCTFCTVCYMWPVLCVIHIIHHVLICNSSRTLAVSSSLPGGGATGCCLLCPPWRWDPFTPCSAGQGAVTWQRIRPTGSPAPGWAWGKAGPQQVPAALL